MKTISIDIETFSSVSLVKSGVYRYTESPDFEILLFAYSINGGKVKIIDLALGETIPEEIILSLSNPHIIKWAFNAQFERICLSRFLKRHLAPEGWHCTMVWSATLGLPLTLAGVGAVLNLEKQKLQEGKNLIKYFCVPSNPNKFNGGPSRNLPTDDMAKWEKFKSYNIRDVETEVEIQKRLQHFPLSSMEWEHYYLDQKINDYGIGLDMDFVHQALHFDEKFKLKYMSIAREITGLKNPNSPAQLKNWLTTQGIKTDSLNKNAVLKILGKSSGDVKNILLIRQELSKSSIKKYTAIKNVVCDDNRARGLIQFYGASRTGRYAGRLIQVQNLPQNHLPDLDLARNLVKNGHDDIVHMLFDSIPKVLSELIRTAFVPRENHRFIVADFSAIEARVIAWLANEKWRLDVFNRDGDIYCASASQMFKVTVEKHGINSHLRQKGKIAELALGYGGSVGALKSMGAIEMGIEENELSNLVTVWRNSNPHITNLWWDVDRAVKYVIKTKNPTITHNLKFFYERNILFITLPSGRNLTYVNPKIGENKFGGESVTYEGVGKSKKWDQIESYGPKFVENIVQGISRDILAETLMNLNKSNYKIVMHIHDEVVLEVPCGESCVDEVCNIMARRPTWAKDLPLHADGYECDFYRKG